VVVAVSQFMILDEFRYFLDKSILHVLMCIGWKLAYGIFHQFVFRQRCPHEAIGCATTNSLLADGANYATIFLPHWRSYIPDLVKTHAFRKSAKATSYFFIG